MQKKKRALEPNITASYGPLLISALSGLAEAKIRTRHFNNINVHFCVTDTQQRNKQILCRLHKFQVGVEKRNCHLTRLGSEAEEMLCVSSNHGYVHASEEPKTDRFRAFIILRNDIFLRSLIAYA